jgi:type II secretory pathway component PulL
MLAPISSLIGAPEPMNIEAVLVDQNGGSVRLVQVGAGDAVRERER